MKKTLIRLFLIASLITLASTATAQDQNPFIGTWDINEAASNFGDAPVPLNMSRTYADVGNGSYMYLVVSTNDDGGLGGSSATYRYDGGEYPIAALDQQSTTTISYRQINNRTVEYTVRIEGVINQIGAKTISPDGRVLTIAIQFPSTQGSASNQILRFDRRR